MENDIWSPTLDKNCGKCTYSQRDVTTLNISCQLGKKINNTWVTAHNCNLYTETHASKKKISNKQKKTNTNQLKLF